MCRGVGTATSAAADRMYVGSNPTPGFQKIAAIESFFIKNLKKFIF